MHSMLVADLLVEDPASVIYRSFFLSMMFKKHAFKCMSYYLRRVLFRISILFNIGLRSEKRSVLIGSTAQHTFDRGVRFVGRLNFLGWYSKFSNEFTRA